MRPFVALALVAALLMAGCSGKGASSEPLTASVAGEAAMPYADARTPLRFSSGDSEGNLTGTLTFDITAQCVFDCAAGGEEVVDLTPIIPANAPVELVVEVLGANCMMTYEDTYGIGVDDGERGQLEAGNKATFSGIFIRADAGKVELHVYNPGGFGIPPNPAPTVDYVAHSTVRAGLLVPGVPASLRLQPGDALNLTGPGVEEAILIAPDGGVTRDAAAPFEVQANGTAGEYILLMLGAEAVPVMGPNATMTAKRLALVEGTPQALASGTPSSWAFDPGARPLLVGMGLRHTETAGGFVVAPLTTDYSMALQSPGNAAVLDAGDACMGPCELFLLGSTGLGYELLATSDFLDERLVAGSYTATASHTGSAAEAVAFAVVVA